MVSAGGRATGTDCADALLIVNIVISISLLASRRDPFRQQQSHFKAQTSDVKTRKKLGLSIRWMTGLPEIRDAAKSIDAAFEEQLS
jgi:hypothetical protein